MVDGGCPLFPGLSPAGREMRVAGGFGEVRFDCGPEFSQQRGGAWGFQVGVAVVGCSEARMAEQMQVFLRAGGGDIEQAAVFVAFFFRVQADQVVVGFVGIGAGLFDRGEEQTGFPRSRE